MAPGGPLPHSSPLPSSPFPFSLFLVSPTIFSRFPSFRIYSLTGYDGAVNFAPPHTPPLLNYLSAGPVTDAADEDPGYGDKRWRKWGLIDHDGGVMEKYSELIWVWRFYYMPKCYVKARVVF